MTAERRGGLFARRFAWLGAIFRFIGRFGCLVQIAAALFLIGVVLSLVGLVFGFSLDDVDAWLADHSSWIMAVADVLFRPGCLFVLLCCGLVVAAAVHGLVRPRRGDDLVAPAEAAEVEDKPPGIGCALLGLVVGYLAFVGTFMRYEREARRDHCRVTSVGFAGAPRGPGGRGSTPKLWFASQILTWARRFRSAHRACAAAAFTPSLPA